MNSYYRKCNLLEKLLFANFDSDKLFKILKKIDESKAPGNDLSRIFRKDGASLLAKQITQLLKLPISSDRFPDACEISKLKALFEKGSKTDPKNYRPISLLPLPSKVLERIVHEQTMEFLDKHSILYKFQPVFRKNYSSDFCLSFDSGLLTGMILIEL